MDSLPLSHWGFPDKVLWTEEPVGLQSVGHGESDAEHTPSSSPFLLSTTCLLLPQAARGFPAEKWPQPPRALSAAVGTVATASEGALCCRGHRGRRLPWALSAAVGAMATASEGALCPLRVLLLCSFWKLLAPFLFVPPSNQLVPSLERKRAEPRLRV